MTTSVHSPGAEVSTLSHLYRVAGIAALVAAATYLIQPIVVFLVQPPTTGAGGYPVAQDLVALRGLAPLEVVEFSTIGISTIVLAVAVYRLSSRAGATVAAQVGAILGVIAGLGWIGAAAGTISGYGFIATNLLDITDDPVLQQAAIQIALLGSGMLSLPVIGSTGWLVLLATSGRRSAVVGWPTAILALVAAVIVAIPAVILLTPFGLLALIPANAALGVIFLVKSRTARAA